MKEQAPLEGAQVRRVGAEADYGHKHTVDGHMDFCDREFMRNQSLRDKPRLKPHPASGASKCSKRRFSCQKDYKTTLGFQSIWVSNHG